MRTRKVMASAMSWHEPDYRDVDNVLLVPTEDDPEGEGPRRSQA